MLSFILGTAIFTFIIHKKYKDAFVEKITNKIMHNSHDADLSKLEESYKLPTKNNPL